MNDWYDAEQRVEKAQELFAQQQWHEALEELRAAIAINPYNSAWYFNVGLTLDELNRFGEAVEAYRQALKIEPDDIEALFHIGKDLLRLGQFDEALLSFNHIEALDPSFEPAYCGRIIAYAELQDHEKAEEMFYLAREYKDECPHCYANIAASLKQRRLYDKAIYCWQKTLDLDQSHPAVHRQIAEAFWEKGELEKARQHYLQELRLNPGDTDALLDMGDLLLEMGRIDEAGEKFRRAIELAPHQPAAYLHYARWQLACDRPAESRQALDKVLELDPGYAEAQMYLGAVCIREGDMGSARRHLRAELRQRPEDPRVLMDLANLLMDCGQSRPAVACLKRLVALEPDMAAGWQNLAVAHFLRREFAAGIAACQQALRCEPEQTTTMYNLALAYERLRDYERAMAWVQRCAQIDPNDLSLQRLELRIRLLSGWARLRRLLGRLLIWRR